MTLTADPRRADAATQQPALRTDIQALRAVAVVAVLLFHLWPNRLTGGFVGVDVFFVISGFLITAHLVREVEQTGRIRVGAFWARRAKRLLPASLLVLAVTAAGVVALVPDTLWPQFLRDVIASALYVENWVLAADAVDYHTAGNAASPVRHFWTLSAEEQFYFALPLLLLGVLWLTRRNGPIRRRALFAALLLVVIASFAYSVWFTATNPASAYFSTFTRAWEFGIGALVAFAAVPRSALARRVVPLLGVAMIAVACLAYSGATPFPGATALLPVAGTALVLWAGRGSFVDTVGAWRPVAFLGETSYAVYLWHWPLIVLLPYATGHPLTTLEKIAIIALSLGLGWVSTKWVEAPVRFSPRLLGGRRRPRTVAAWSVAGMAVVIAVAGTGLVVDQQRGASYETTLRAVQAAPPDCFGAASMDASAPCENPALESTLVPDPSIATTDDANDATCWGIDDSGAPRICTLVDPPGAERRVMAVGDSHNNTLIGAYRAIAESQGWRMDVAGFGGCYLTTAKQAAPSADYWKNCLQWREGVMSDLAADPPDAIIVTNASAERLVQPDPGETLEQATRDGIIEAWGALPDVPILAIRDNPGMTDDTLECVSVAGTSAAEECALPRSTALSSYDGQPDAVAATPRASLIDLTDMYCTETSCAPVIGGALVYRDRSHVTATWALTLAPYLEDAIVRELGW